MYVSLKASITYISMMYSRPWPKICVGSVFIFVHNYAYIYKKKKRISQKGKKQNNKFIGMRNFG